jgi:hypothetical protein
MGDNVRSNRTASIDVGFLSLGQCGADNPKRDCSQRSEVVPCEDQ